MKPRPSLQNEISQQNFLRSREVGEFLSGALAGAMTKAVLAPLETISCMLAAVLNLGVFTAAAVLLGVMGGLGGCLQVMVYLVGWIYLCSKMVDVYRCGHRGVTCCTVQQKCSVPNKELFCSTSGQLAA
ncbi:hypothetical protein LOK49_LG14G00697 [Camellia lanceoleosa]|uniref:Uncharacterized protein n=1 Tax=Camellia lanceoleosa TaxID=1840588 RepID=A0ACC0FCR5_9ERIC|nr:hypothetical protein LOK49_LG14G00697 [Camellia lanceoleosa]